MKAKNGPPTNGEELNNWEVEAYQAELEASREFDWEHRRPEDFQRILDAKNMMEINAKAAAEIAKAPATQQQAAPGEPFFPPQEQPAPFRASKRTGGSTRS